jgi:putative ABC transport system permease protein
MAPAQPLVHVGRGTFAGDRDRRQHHNLLGAVSRRTREIGIRIALGADSSAVLRLILRQGLVLAVIGVAIGAGLAAIASRFIESLLFGVRGVDPLTFASAAGLFAVVTLVASYFPARRATKVDPMVALRSE